MLASEVQDNLIFKDVYLVSSIQPFSTDQRSIGDYSNAVSLSQLNQRSIGQVRMNLYLQCNWLYLTNSQQLHNQLAIKIGKAKMSHISFSYAQFQLRPNLLQGFMIELPQFISICIWPVQVQQVKVFQLHQLQSFLYLPLHTLSFEIKHLGGNEQLLSLYPSLRNYCLYSISQRDLIVIQPCSVDMFASPNLESFSQQICEQLFILNAGSAQTLKGHDLLVGECLEWRPFLLFSFLLSHCQLYYFKSQINHLQIIIYTKKGIIYRNSFSDDE